MKTGWQKHPSTMTAHFFSPAERGTTSICSRAEFVFDGKLFAEPGIFPCSFCIKKIKKLGDGSPATTDTTQ